MRRREILKGMSGLGLMVFAAPRSARAQQVPGKVHRVGLFFATIPVSDLAGPEPVNPFARVFVHAMRDLGYVEGRNLVLEHRSAGGRWERFDEILTGLVARKVDVIVTIGNDMTLAATRVTSAVPIVMAGSTDPVEAGIVTSLARPGGNVTGLTFNTGPGFEAKRLQLLKEAVPEATRVAYLVTKTEWEGLQGTGVRAAAPTLGVTLVHAEHTPTHYADAFALITREKPHALFVSRHGSNYVHRQLIADFAVEQRLPSMFPYRENVEAGGLMSYGLNLPDQWRRAAGHVDKILRGTKPADIPVEQPTKFELVINGKTAKVLGITIPPTLLNLADEVIE
jgi:putative tryptophan/tyrosine transport system substrate-binding protein